MSRDENSERSANVDTDPEWVLQNLGWVRALSLRLAGGPELADDVAQEAWVRLLQNPPPAGVVPVAWVTGVVKKVTLDLRRRQRASRERELRVTQERIREEDASSANAGRLEHQLDVEREVVSHVRALPEPLRRTLLLRYFERCSIEEIASQEGITMSTVRSRLSRGVHELRKRLRADPTSTAGAFFAVLLPKQGTAALATGSVKALTAIPKVPSIFALMSLSNLSLIVAAGLVLFAGVFLSLQETEAVSGVNREAPIVVELGAPEELASAVMSPVETKRRTPVASAAPADPPASGQASDSDVPDGIQVVVLDQGGDPVNGVPVALIDTRYDADKRVLASAVSQGSVSVRLNPGAIEAPENSEARWRVIIDAPGHGNSGVTLDPAALPHKPVELTLSGEVGTVSVRAVDLEGHPLGHQVTFSLGSPLTRNQQGITVQPGQSAVFRAVPVGERYRVYAKTAPGLDAAFLRSPALTQPGEIAELDVAFGPSGPTIVGTIEVAGEAPIQKLNSIAVTMGTGESTHEGKLTIEPGGAFHATFPGVFEHGVPCWFQLGGTLDSRSASVYAARVDASMPASGAPLDLGVVELVLASRTIKGQVVRNGSPLGAFTFVDLYRRSKLRSNDWRTQGWSVMTDKEGRFTISIPSEPGSDFCLAVDDPQSGIISDRLMVDSTTTEAVLEVRSAVKLSGRVILPADWGDSRILYVNWAHPEESNSHPTERLSRVDEDGFYVLEGAPVGEIDLVLRRNLRDGEFLRWESVTVTGDEPTAELEDWVIEEELQRLRFELRLPESVEPGGWMVTSGKWNVVQDGAVDLWMSKADQPLAIGCYGCMTHFGSTNSVGSVVTLEPAIQVTLRIKGADIPQALATGPLWVRLKPVADEGADGHPSGGTGRNRPVMGIARLDEQRSVTTLFPETGVFDVEIWHGKGPSRQLVDSAALPPNLRNAQVTIAEDSREQSFVIGAD